MTSCSESLEARLEITVSLRSNETIIINGYKSPNYEVIVSKIRLNSLEKNFVNIDQLEHFFASSFILTAGIYFIL